MVRYKSRLVKSIMFALIILAYFFLGEWVGALNSEIPDAEKGIPTFYKKDSDLAWLNIEKVVGDEACIYVLFDDFQGILQIYDTDGRYLQSVSFYNRQANGAFQIAEEDNMVYIQDKRGNLYLFRHGEFLEYLDSDACTDLRKQIDFESDSEKYTVKWESVWYADATGEICVIERPVTALLNKRNLFLLFCGSIFVWAAYRYIVQNKTR